MASPSDLVSSFADDDVMMEEVEVGEYMMSGHHDDSATEMKRIGASKLQEVALCEKEGRSGIEVMEVMHRDRTQQSFAATAALVLLQGGAFASARRCVAQKRRLISPSPCSPMEEVGNLTQPSSMEVSAFDELGSSPLAKPPKPTASIATRRQTSSGEVGGCSSSRSRESSSMTRASVGRLDSRVRRVGVAPCNQRRSAEPSTTATTRAYEVRTNRAYHARYRASHERSHKREEAAKPRRPRRSYSAATERHLAHAQYDAVYQRIYGEHAATSILGRQRPHSVPSRPCNEPHPRPTKPAGGWRCASSENAASQLRALSRPASMVADRMDRLNKMEHLMRVELMRECMEDFGVMLHLFITLGSTCLLYRT